MRLRMVEGRWSVGTPHPAARKRVRVALSLEGRG